MFEEIVRQLRLERGLTQVQLAKKLFVTKQSVSNWENGNIVPSVELLMKIARFFSVSTDYLLGLDNRRYLEITGLTDEQIAHLQMVIDDLRKINSSESPEK